MHDPLVVSTCSAHLSERVNGQSPASASGHIQRRTVLILGFSKDELGSLPTPVGLVLEVGEGDLNKYPYQFHRIHHVVAKRTVWQERWSSWYGVTGRLTWVDNYADILRCLGVLQGKWASDKAGLTTPQRSSARVSEVIGLDSEADKRTSRPTNEATEASSCTRDGRDDGRHRGENELAQLPKHLHFMWLSPTNDPIPGRYHPNLATWREYHPDWLIHTWNMAQVEALAAEHWPHYLARFRALPKIISKCDLARMMVLYVYGGVYADLDFWCMRSLNSLVAAHPILLMREVPEHERLHQALFNGILAFPPRAQFVAGWIDAMFANLVMSHDYGINLYVMKTTGPYAFYNYYASLPMTAQPSLSPTQWLLPFTNNHRLSEICAPDVDYYAYTLWCEGTGWGKASAYTAVILICVALILLLLVGWAVVRLVRRRWTRGAHTPTSAPVVKPLT